MKYQTIVADPPWPQPMMGHRQRKRFGEHGLAVELPYQAMTVAQIKALPVADIAEAGAHLWLWTTNAFLRDGFDVMEAWGFTHLAPITWVKPTGIGNYFVHRTQTVLFGYRGRCDFSRKRYVPTVFMSGVPSRHSQKPDAFMDLVESVSQGPYVELFARQHRVGWDVWGDEVESAAIWPTLSVVGTPASDAQQ